MVISPPSIHDAAPAPLKWLYIDFNSYFASVEQQLNPTLRGKPIAVVAVETDSTCAIAASYEAKAYGVKTGTPIHEAKKMCPGLICVLANHQNYVAYHHRILDEIARHIPVSAVCSIDEMGCQLMRNEAPLDRALDLASRIKEGIAKNVGAYIKCSIGIAPNRYLAKIATDLKKPDGLTVIAPEDLPHKLYELSLRDLPGIGRNMEQRLNRAHIHDMRQLMALSPKHLRAVWGNLWGEKIWYMLRGIDIPNEQEKGNSIGHSQVLAPDQRPKALAWPVARRLTVKAAARLRRAKYMAGMFSLSVRLENGERYARDIRSKSVADSFTFLELLARAWADIMREVKQQRLKKISVTLSQLTPEDQTQEDLFDTIKTETSVHQQKMRKLSDAMDQLNHKFGRDTILPGILPSEGRNFSGTKVAFTRIPDIEEFVE